MELTVQMFLIVCPLVFLASFIDAIAGGGGLISLPAYLFVGLPAHYAIGSNKLSSTIGTVASTWRYCKHKYYDLTTAVPSIVTAFIGSVIGARLALMVEEEVLTRLLVVVLPIVAYFVLFKKKEEGEVVSPWSKKQLILLSMVISFVVGSYDGFYGPGTGTFLILLFTSVCKMDIKTASGNTKLINLTSNVAALMTFLINGNVLLPLALAASVFSVLGHYIGAGFVVKKGLAVVKPLILVVLALLMIKILL
ncbi:MAG: TSUP family transporter [Lachnospiraceae bacterium]